MQPVDYKSKELNLYSNNGVGHLKFQDGKGSGLGPGFGQNQEYIFAKYTDSANGNMQWPVCIPELHTIDNSTGYVMGVGWYIMDTRSQVADEKKARENEDFALGAQLATLNSNISAESKARADAVSNEAKSRVDGDAKSASDLAAETAARQQADNGNWATILIVEADSKTRDSALEVKLGIESTRALAAEGVVQANVDAEAKSRVSEIKRLDGRIDFITSNADGAAIDSLAEIVSQFSTNGQTYANRLTYLEGIVAALVNKSQ
jgi:hypothetical protein